MPRPPVPAAKLDPLLGCAIWQGALTTKGYPVMRYEGKTRLARRVFYERAKGSIPDGCQVVMMCDRRDCILPAHMEARRR